MKEGKGKGAQLCSLQHWHYAALVFFDNSMPLFNVSLLSSNEIKYILGAVGHSGCCSLYLKFFSRIQGHQQGCNIDSKAKKYEMNIL